MCAFACRAGVLFLSGLFGSGKGNEDQCWGVPSILWIRLGNKSALVASRLNPNGVTQKYRAERLTGKKMVGARRKRIATATSLASRPWTRQGGGGARGKVALCFSLACRRANEFPGLNDGCFEQSGWDFLFSVQAYNWSQPRMRQFDIQKSDKKKK